MAGKIQLTPRELLDQSQEMLSLQGEYEELFRQSETLLNQVNENWSAALAHNFSGKLLSAQKSFQKISAMLGSGGSLAAESARTYESMDSLLARNIHGGGGWSESAADTAGQAVTAGAAGVAGVIAASGISINAVGEAAAAGAVANPVWKWGKFYDYVVKQTKEDWKTAGQTLQEISDWYDSIPENGRRIVDEVKKKVIPKQLDTAYQTVKDILTGEVDWDTGKNVAKTIIGGTNYQIIEDTFQYADKVKGQDQEYMERTVEQARKGNVLACLTNMAGSFLDEVGMGAVSVGGGLIGDVISKVPGVSFLEEQFGFNVKESIDSFVDKGQKAMRKGIQDTVEKVGEIEEKVRGTLVNTVKSVGREAKKVIGKAGEGLKKVGDALKGFFKW